MYFYLSLPVFSHWQGRLDPRAMILGSTRKGAMAGTGLNVDVRGRAPRGVGLQRAIVLAMTATHPADLPAAEIETGGATKRGVINMIKIGMNPRMCRHLPHLLESPKYQLASINQKLLSK